MIEKVFKGVKNSKTSYKSRKRILLIFFFVVLIFAALAVRLGWHMIIKGDEYAVKASKQQTIDKVVTAVRGESAGHQRHHAHHLGAPRDRKKQRQDRSRDRR